MTRYTKTDDTIKREWGEIKLDNGLFATVYANVRVVITEEVYYDLQTMTTPPEWNLDVTHVDITELSVYDDKGNESLAWVEKQPKIKAVNEILDWMGEYLTDEVNSSGSYYL